jgi:DNA polymerase III sliding clamp (beta) subunit (PCNA family)
MLLEGSLVVDTPDLMDAVRKAATVSASRGAARDIAAGIQFSVQNNKLLVKATDLETTYRCEVDLIELVGLAPEPFRLPAAVMAKYLAQLPMGQDSRITITPRYDLKVELECGECRATFSTITGDSFPLIDAFDVDQMGEVDGLAHRLRQVSWACHADSEPLSGIHIDGKRLIGCDKAALALVDCVVPVDLPLTAPLSGVAAALRGHNGPMSMALRGNKLLLVPEPDTQFGTTTYATQYPNVQPLIDLTQSNRVTLVSKEYLEAALSRINALCAGERYPRLDIMVDGNKINLESRVDQLGLVEDAAFMEDELEDVLEISFNPSTFATAVSHASSTTLLIAWPNSDTGFVRIEDGAGYTAVLCPIKRL